MCISEKDHNPRVNVKEGLEYVLEGCTYKAKVAKVGLGDVIGINFIMQRVQMITMPRLLMIARTPPQQSECHLVDGVAATTRAVLSPLL